MTPFEPFKNSTLVFLIEDPLAPDTIDSAGNPTPTKQEVTLEAFLKPAGVYGKSRHIKDSFPGLGVNAVQLEGFVTSNDGRTPVGINPGDRTVYAKYRDQEGTAIWLLDVQSSVGADLITGDAITIVMQVLGGE